MKKIIRIYYLA